MSSSSRRLTTALGLLALTGGCSTSDSGTNPQPTPTIAVSVTPTSLSLPAGEAGQAVVTITRGGGYSGAVTLSLEGAPAGVTGNFTPASVAGGSTTSTLDLSVVTSATAGSYTLTIRATGSGVSPATATLSLAVTPPPSFRLALIPATLNVNQGSSSATLVGITRDAGFTGGVTFTLEGAPAGITGAFSPNPSTTNSSSLTLDVANTVAAGNYNLTVRGTAAGLPAQTAQLAVTVLAPAGSFSLAIIPAALGITQGQNADVAVTITRTGGFSAGVTLALEGAPAGVTGSFVPNPATGAASTLTITVGASVAPGNYNLTVRGTTPNPSPDGSLTPAAAAQMAADQTVDLVLTVTVAGGYTLSATPASVAQGGNGNSTVSINRTGGNTSSVSLALEGAPAGVTGSFGPNPATGATSTLTLTVGAAVAVGNYPITVRGTAAGLIDQTTTFQLSVTAAPGFSLSANPTGLSIAQGSNGNSTITVNRTGGFAGSVALTSSTDAPAGVTVAFNPTSTTGTSSTMTVTVGGGVATGSYTITVKGNSSGQSEQTTTVGLTVTTGGGSGSVNWTFCDQSGIPVWAAYQNGTSGTWTQTTPTGNTFSFNITDTKGGIAWVELNGAEAMLSITYGSIQELQNNAPACRGDGTTKTVNATMANLVPPSSSQVFLGSGFAQVTSANQANFAIANVPPGTLDLVVTNYTQNFVAPFGQTLNGIIIRRGLDPAANSTLVPTLDWNGAEKITPVNKTLTVTNGSGNLQATVAFLTSNGTGALLGTFNSGAPYSFSAVPDASRQAGDLHSLTVSTVLQNLYAYQAVTRIFAAAADQSVTLGSAPPAVAFTTGATAPYLRPRIAFTNTAEYSRSIQMYWANAGGNQSSATVMIWEGYGQGLTVDYTLPDFSGVAGWNNAWGLQSGVGNVAGGLNVTGWTAGGGPGQPPQADGTTAWTAGRRVDNISP